MSKRPKWDEIWMSVAETIATRSCDHGTKVGCIVVTDDNTQLLSLGYNGNYAGGPNERESNVPGEGGLLHAEINCLIKLDYNNPKTKIMYITHSPCKMCAKAIVNSGVKKVVFKNFYRDTSGLDILDSANIEWVVATNYVT
jgi:dCMP deaminase